MFASKETTKVTEKTNKIQNPSIISLSATKNSHRTIPSSSRIIDHENEHTYVNVKEVRRRTTIDSNNSSIDSVDSRETREVRVLKLMSLSCVLYLTSLT